jgi:ubiquinone/menaquinone biosynthesis C-methylase UbiE
VKDLFSVQSALYAKYRPTYPAELYEYVLRFVEKRETAWDCATGNGQVARILSSYFQRVFATDISENQLRHAEPAENIIYSLSTAEKTPFADNSFDLITVGQAFHWFDATAFCREASRVARPGAIVAVWGYVSGTPAHEVGRILHRWNYEVLSAYWEPERKHVHARYETIPFNFEFVDKRDFQVIVEWNFDELAGHMRTWSAHQNMIRQAGDAAFLKTLEEMRNVWHDGTTMPFVFDVFMKVGRVRK